jgi:hypothetical protein
VFPRFRLGFMISKYVIFKLRSDGSFMWIEAVEYILAAKQDAWRCLLQKNPVITTFGILQPTSS